jgi:hypothetical protein
MLAYNVISVLLEIRRMEIQGMLLLAPSSATAVHHKPGTPAGTRRQRVRREVVVRIRGKQRSPAARRSEVL